MISLGPLQKIGSAFLSPRGLLRDIATDRVKRRQLLVSLSPFVLICVLIFARLGHRDLYSSHEARAAQNAQRMIDTGEWGLPVLFDGRSDLQKPPGYYWAVAAIGWLNGEKVTEWVARFPAAIAGFICTLLVFAFLRQEGRPTAAVVAMIVLATANHFTGIARTARIDVPLTCMVTLSLLAFYRGCRIGSNELCLTRATVTQARSASEGQLFPRWRFGLVSRQTAGSITGSRGHPLAWHLLAAIAAAVAVLLKGPVGPALIGPTAILWLAVERLTQSRSERPRVPIASWFLIPIVVVAIAVPWFVWANKVTDGEFFRVFFWHHTVARYTGSSPLLASHPWWYYVPRFLVDFMPWTPLLNCLVVWVIRVGRWRTDPVFRFSLIAFLAMFTILSSAHFKRSDYLLPAYPFAAIALGCAAESWLASRSNPGTVRTAKWVFGGAIGVSVVCWLIMMFHVEPAEQKKEEKRRFAAMIRSHAPAPQTILQFRMESHLLSYHLGRPVYTFVEWAELNEILAAPGPHFVVMPPEYVYPAAEIIRSRKLVTIARIEEYTHGKPLRPLVFLRTAD
jgi:4-amino-4-deoxy-L-arabinose transferase-like glycosyltransferase